MSVFKKVNQSKSKFQKGGFDESIVKDWQTQNEEHYNALSGYYDKINSGGYLSADDLSAYDTALKGYVATGNKLRNINKSYGKGYTAEEDKKWTDSLTAMQSDFDNASKFYGSFETEQSFKDYLSSVEENKRLEAIDLDTLGFEISNLEKSVGERDAIFGKLSEANVKLQTAYEMKDTRNIRLYEELVKQYQSQITEIDELNKGLDQKKRDYTLAERYQQGKALTNNALNAEDFELYSQKGADIENPSGWDAVKGLNIGTWRPFAEKINNKVTFAQNPENAASTPELFIYSFMNEEEVSIYNYYLGKGDTESAEEYLQSIEEELNSRKAGRIVETIGDNGFLQMSFAFAAGVEQFGTGIENLFSDKDYYSQTAAQIAGGQIRENLGNSDLKIFGNTIGQIGYDIFNTTGNMMPSILVSYIPVVGQVAGAASMGLSAMGNAKAEMINLGYSQEQANAYGVLVGASEAGLQYLLGGISKLGGKASGGITEAVVGKIDNAFARVSIKHGKNLLHALASGGAKLGINMASEGLEESIQTILEPWFKSIVTSEAYKAPNIDEVLYSGLLGALSAGFLEGIGTVGETAQYYSVGKAVQKAGAVDRLAKTGSLFSADSVAYKIAGRVNENTGAYTLGRLLYEVDATLTEQNKAEITEALIQKGMDEKTAKKHAEWLSYVAEGAEMTDEQIDIIESNEVVSRVFYDVIVQRNTTEYQRMQAFAEKGKTAKVQGALQSTIKEGKNSKVAERTKGYKDIAVDILMEKMGLSKDTGKTTEEDFAYEATEEEREDDEYMKQKSYSPLTSKGEVEKRAKKVQYYKDARESTAHRPRISTEGKSTQNEKTAEKTAKESVFSYNADGKTIYKDKEVSVKGIDSIKNGVVSVRLDNNEVVDAKEVSFSSKDEALMYEMVADLGVNGKTATKIIELRGDTEPMLYAIEAPMAYKYGKIGYTKGLGNLTNLSYEQKTALFGLGQTDAKADAEARTEASKQGVAKSAPYEFKGEKIKKNGVEYLGVNPNELKGDLQKANVFGAEFLAKVSRLEIALYASEVKNGKRVVTINGKDILAPNGMFREGNKIYLDVNAGRKGEGTMLFTMSHEVGHYIRQWNAKAFKELGDLLFENYEGEISVEGLINDEIEALKAQRKAENKKMPTEAELFDTAYEEVVCNALSKIFADETTFVKLAKEVKAKNKSLWAKIGEAIKAFLKKLKDVIGIYSKYDLSIRNGAMTMNMATDVYNKLQDMYIKAFVEADENYAKQSNVESTKGETSETKYSLDSMRYSFFGDKKGITIKDFENDSYKKEEGYKEYVSKCLNNMRQTLGRDFSESEALKEIESSIDGIVKVAVAMKKAGYDIFDNQAKRSAKDSKNRLLFSSLEPNSDYFTSSDISTICDKRKNFAEIYDDIVRKEEELGVPRGKRFFDNVDNYFLIHKIMADKGLTQPCRQCYVESMRKNLAPMAKAFLDLMQETDPNNKKNKQLFNADGTPKSNNTKTREWLLQTITEEDYDITADKLTVEMLTTADGLAHIKLQAPLIYEAFNSFYGQSKPKMPKAATPFRFGELTALLTDDNGKIKDSLIKKIIATGGFRLQSYSDFQIQNFADVLQVIFEAGTLGLNGHAYTKVPAFLDATKGTNLKRNISIFMYNDDGEWRLDKNDSFPYDLDKIYDIVKSDKQGNTGIIAVVQNEDMASFIMANDNIGYFIPFHKSGIKMGVVRETVVEEDGRKIQGYKNIKDHTRQQTEVWAFSNADHKALTKVKNGINIYEFWDFKNADNLSKNELIEKNVKAYIDACNEAGYLPKFREYVMNNEKVLNSVLAYSKQLGFVAQDATIDDISFEYNGYRIPYGYYKCLGDFGMFTPDGKASTIERLSLKDYNFNEAVKFFSDAESVRRTEILQQISNGKERARYITGDKAHMTTAEIADEVQAKRNEAVDEVVSGKYKDTQYSTRDSEGNTLTEAQQEFFKDSKVRDEQGRLLVVYHSTDADFTVFDVQNKNITGELYYFAKSKAWSKNFHNEELYHAPKRTMGVYLNMTKPFDLRNAPNATTGKKWIEYLESVGVPISEEFRSYWSLPQKNVIRYGGNPHGEGVISQWKLIRHDGVSGNLRETLKSIGYDGFIIKDKVFGRAENTSYVCFDPNQIKSTANKNPTSDPDIRYSLREAETSAKDFVTHMKNLVKTEGKWYSRDVYEYVEAHPELNFIDRIYEKDKQVKKDLTNFLDNINDVVLLDNLSWFMGGAYSSKGFANTFTYPYRGAVRTFKNAVNKRINALMTEKVNGTNLGVTNGEYSLREVKDFFEKLNGNVEIGKLAEKVFATAKHLGVNIRFTNKTFASNAVGDALGDMIEYKTSYFNDTAVSDQKKASTILHELIHACTVYVMDAHQGTRDYRSDWKSDEYLRLANAAIRLNKIYEEIKGDDDFAGQYGLKNAKEMVAELSNEDFVALLKKKNLWERIVDWICDLFGIRRGNSAYENAMLCLDYILDNPDYIEYTSFASNARALAEQAGLEGFGKIAYFKEDTMYSLREVAPIEPTSKDWKRTLTTAEVKAQFPDLWDVSADESEVRNPTQVKVTVGSYRKIYNFLKKTGFKGTILDASSGLGYGTKAGIEEYGFKVDDIEPYPDKSYTPKYTDYSKLHKQYDVIISNAVLNVIPQDQRDALVVKMGELLKVGGRMFVNVRGDDVKNASSKVAINEDLMEYYISNTGSYQKGFTKDELVAYLKDALGEGYTVMKTSFFGKTSAVVTKNEDQTMYSIREGMTEEERYNELKDKKITVFEDTRSANYSEIKSLEELHKKAKSKAEKIIKPLAEKLGILNKSMKTPEVEIDFLFSKNNGLTESLSKQLRYGGSYADFAKAIINLDKVLERAVLIEVHGDKYANTVKADLNLERVYVLFSAFKDGGSIIPIQLEIKKHSQRGGRLYMTVAMTKIEAGVLGRRNDNKNYRAFSLMPTSEYSLADIFKNVNQIDRHFLKYIPNGFLTEEQKEAKQIAIQEDNERISKYSVRSENEASNRSLLADALESVVQNEKEAEMLSKYKATIGIMEENERMLAEMKEQLFSKGIDNETRKKLRFEINKIANNINTYDKQLYRLEANAHLKAVLEREKTKAYERAKQRGRDALKAYREQVAKKMRESATRYQQQRKDAVNRVRETREKNDAKDRLQQLVLETSKWISYPTKNDVKCPDILRKPYAKFLESIDLSSKRKLEGGRPTQNDLRMASAMDSLATALEGIKVAQDPSVTTDNILDSGYLDLPANFVEKLREMAENAKNLMVDGDFVVNHMTSNEIRELCNLIRILNHSIKEMSTLYSNLRFAKVEELGENSITFLDSMGEAKGTNGVADFVGWDNALPYYAFKRFGEGGESVFEELMDAQDKLAYHAETIFKFKEKTWTDKEAKAWGEDTHTIELTEEKKIVATTADVMGIYCLSRRLQAVPHLLGGGIKVIGEKKGAKKAQDSRSTLSQEDINIIVKSLTERQKKVAEAIQEFMSTVCADWGNEISMKRFLTKEFNEPNYYPIESNDENLPQKDPQAQQSDLYRLLNISATKPTVKGANNEVIIRNIFDVFTNHASDMARLNAFGMALLDYMKWLNYREKIMNADGVSFKMRGVVKAMGNTYGDKAKSYVVDLIKDINGRSSDGKDHPWLMKMTRLAKTASVGFNARVVLLQVTSYPRAGMVLSAGSLAKGLTKLPSIDKAKKYCGIALWKSFGFYDTNIARSIEDQIKGATNVRQKLIELSLKGAEWADAITWGALWNACEYEVAKTTKNKVGSEEFNQEVGKKLREVVYATQVVDSTLTRTKIMRNKSGLTQTLTAFMSEPSLTANILMNAGFQFHKEKRITGSAKIAWQKTGKLIGKTIAIYSSVAILTSVVESLLDAYRDDDDEEFIEKFGEAFLENSISNIIPFNKIPIISDITEAALSLFGVGYFSSDNMALTQISDIKNALTAWGNVLFKEDSSTTVYGALYKTIKALSSSTGISVSGLMREIATLWNNTAGAFDPTLKLQSYDPSKTELRKQLYEAIVEGKDEKIVGNIKNEFGFEKESEYASALRQALRENDSRIKEAAQAVLNGNHAERIRLTREIVAEGHFRQDTVVSAINAEITYLRSKNKQKKN